VSISLVGGRNSSIGFIMTSFLNSHAAYCLAGANNLIIGAVKTWRIGPPAGTVPEQATESFGYNDCRRTI